MTNFYERKFLGLLRNPSLRMKWDILDGRLVCRWVDCDEPLHSAERDRVNAVLGSSAGAAA